MVSDPFNGAGDITMNPILTKLSQEMIRKDVPQFKIGDTVQVHVILKEGSQATDEDDKKKKDKKEHHAARRTQVYTGIVIARNGGGVTETFTVRRVSFGEGVERVFPVHSPIIDKVVVERSSPARRAKLYYLRNQHGKQATAV
jgi:large subunit ribosomal protein L19